MSSSDPLLPGDAAGAGALTVSIPSDSRLAPAPADLGSSVLAAGGAILDDVPPQSSAPPGASARGDDPAAILATSSPVLNAARDAALAVLANDLVTRNGLAAHSAGPGYDEPWIRDSFAWGMIPNNQASQLAPYTGPELRLWLGRQAASGQWTSNPQSGFFDETAILISAALDAYRVTGDRALLAEALPRLRRGWAWLRGNANGRDSTYLLWTPLPAAGPRLALPVAVDWADQVGRRNYAGQLNLLWYRATQSMAVAEHVLGNAGESGRYTAFAAGIRSDFNRLLWTTGRVEARNAAPVSTFGHYRSWYPAERDYFELDTNFQAILYGIADAPQRDSVLDFVSAHAGYLLGTEGGAPPARTVYGDYAPADYAQIRNKLGDGLYHNAYWLSTGGLAAAAYQQAGQPAMQQRLLNGMAAALTAGQATNYASEWYDIRGKPGGVPAYQWSARAYLHALYESVAGIDWSEPNAENLRVMAPTGDGLAQIVHLGKRLRVQTHGSGPLTQVLVDGRSAPNATIIPEAVLHDGSRIDIEAGD